MCNRWCLDFARRLPPLLAKGTRMLEVGSRNVNGSVRDILEPHGASYCGVDIEAGPGVDQVLDVVNLDQAFAADSFEVVITTEMLEHCPDWKEALRQMVRVLKPGGLLLLTTRSPGFALHGYPHDYWRFSRGNIQNIFSSLGEILVLQDDLTLNWPCGIGVIVQCSMDEKARNQWGKSLAEVEIKAVDPERDRPDRHRPPVPVEDSKTEKVVRSLDDRLKSMLWRSGARAIFNRLGLNVTPANFYSPLPSVEDIRNSFEYAGATIPYADCPFIDNGYFGTFLNELMPYSAEFTPPREGNVENPLETGGYYWKAPAFNYSDAMAYYCIIRKAKPKKIVEVGSGFSTLIADAAVRRNREDDAEGEIICIEPYPKSWLGSIASVSEVKERPVQEVPVAWFQDTLADGDILFIDSTHVAKTGSDCLWLYLKVLPALKKRLMIHAHDIFLPHGYPMDWLLEKHIYWNEQYLLQALLTDNPRCRACWGSNWNLIYHPDRLKSFMGGKQIGGGGSFWWEQGTSGQ